MCDPTSHFSHNCRRISIYISLKKKKKKKVRTSSQQLDELVPSFSAVCHRRSGSYDVIRVDPPLPRSKWLLTYQCLSGAPTWLARCAAVHDVCCDVWCWRCIAYGEEKRLSRSDTASMGASCARGLPEHGGNMYDEERRVKNPCFSQASLVSFESRPCLD